MTELSPAAQAVLDAFCASEGGIYLEGDPKRLAAAFRAAADHVAPVQRSIGVGGGFRQHRSATAERLANRRELLAIATELENIND